MQTKLREVKQMTSFSSGGPLFGKDLKDEELYTTPMPAYENEAGLAFISFTMVGQFISIYDTLYKHLYINAIYYIARNL